MLAEVLENQGLPLFFDYDINIELPHTMRYNERKEQKGGHPMKRYTVEKRKIPSTGRDIKILIFRPIVAKEAIAKFEAEFVSATEKYFREQNN